MHTLAHQRCFHHALREAAVRCPECQRFFCRECVTEHDDRLLCASCLKKKAGPTERRQRRLQAIIMAGQFVCGLLVAWIFFYFVGRALLTVPASVHEGTVWQGSATEEP